MKASSDHILTSHAGSLPRPDELIVSWSADDDRALAQKLTAAVAEVVRRQKQLSIDVPGDGEYGKSMGHRVNYGAWWRYSFLRLGGLDMGGLGLYELPARRSRPGEVVLTSFADRRLHLGYRGATVLDSGPLGAAGSRYRGHEFHYATVVEHGRAEPLLSVTDAAGGDLGACGLRQGSVFGSFIHLVDQA